LDTPTEADLAQVVAFGF
jgi:hypothetical protein